jgi:hypothetical protein
MNHFSEKRIVELKIFPVVKLFPIVFIGIFLIGCASYGPAQVSGPIMSEAEKEEGMKTIVSCLTAKISLYDDNISPPETIAPSVAEACSAEIEAFRLNAIRGQSSAYVNGFMSQWEKITEPTISKLIVQERISRNERI